MKCRIHSTLTMSYRTTIIRGRVNFLFCNKKISDKAKYCSEAHRKAYVRRTKVGQEPGQNDPDIATRTFDFELTRTDRLFEDFKPNYYNFSAQSEKVFDKEC